MIAQLFRRCQGRGHSRPDARAQEGNSV